MRPVPLDYAGKDCRHIQALIKLLVVTKWQTRDVENERGPVASATVRVREEPRLVEAED